ncbi:MAG: hypothetical protein JXA03_15580, partial [Bacteroidales bacterium]|nr:hypothetical protein [Bacteroidales bacterium]
MEKIKYIIELIDGFGKPMKGVVKSADDLNHKIRATKNPLNDVNKSFLSLHQQIERYKSLRDESFRTDHIRKYNQMIRQTEMRIRDLGAKTKTCGEKASGLFGVFGKWLPWLSAYQGVTWIKQLTSDSMAAAAQVETYMVTLQNLLGGRLSAMERMNEYMRIAQKTPFELNEVVEAGNKLQSLGRYSEDTLKMLGDLAAASGKPFEQVMNAYANLATGQRGEAVRMFRDLLISGEDWMTATGEQIDQMTTDQMEKALPQIMKQKGFFGLMAQQA